MFSSRILALTILITLAFGITARKGKHTVRQMSYAIRP